MISRNRSFLLLAGAAIGLSACGSSNNGSTPPPPVTAPVAKVETQFGTCFATRYEAAPNTTATDPVPCPDLPPLSLTTKPVAL